MAHTHFLEFQNVNVELEWLLFNLRSDQIDAHLFKTSESLANF